VGRQLQMPVGTVNRACTAFGRSRPGPVRRLRGRPSIVWAEPVRGENMRFAGSRQAGGALSSDDDPRTVVLPTPRAAVRGLQPGSGGRGWPRRNRAQRAPASSCGERSTRYGEQSARIIKAFALSAPSAVFEGPGGIRAVIATTGRRIAGSGVQIGRYERGHVTLVRVYYDRVDVLGELGDTGGQSRIVR
jgi:hypothetical protein